MPKGPKDIKRMLLEFDGTFIFATFSFIIFMLIMNLILYRPITKIMEERQKFYDKNKNTVVESKKKAEEILKEGDNTLLLAKLEASSILQGTQDKIKEEKEAALKEKREETRSRLSLSEAKILDEKTKVKDELQGELEHYANLAVSKILDEGA